jgi:acetyltransferase-like isoleucine patch superfamily enzyme
MNIKYIWAKVLKKMHGSAIIRSNIHYTSKVESGSQVVNSIMQRYSFCGYDCVLINCEIGSFCSIANNVIVGGAMHPVDWVSTSPVFYAGRDSVKQKFSTHKREVDKITKIGHDVWIGQNVIIKQGVTIGTGAVIGMGSVVTKDVEPYTIVAGNPAKLIKMRFDEDTIIKLQQSKWWELDKKYLKVYAADIKDPAKFIKYFIL